MFRHLRVQGAENRDTRDVMTPDYNMACTITAVWVHQRRQQVKLTERFWYAG